MAQRSTRSAFCALAALAALSAAPSPCALAAEAEPEAEPWRVVCTMDGREVLRREPVFRVWHAGDEIDEEPVAAAAPGTTVCRWEALAEAPAPAETDGGIPPPAPPPAHIWEAPDLAWLTAASPPPGAVAGFGPQRPVLIAVRPAVRAAPAALRPALVELAPAPTEAAARDAFRRLALAHAGLLAGRIPEIVTLDIAGIGVFHRARLSLRGPEEASRLCAALTGAGEGCWVADAG